MRRRALPLLLVPVALGLTLGRAQEPPPASASPWGTDLAEARARAAREGKPLAVVFRCEP